MELFGRKLRVEFANKEKPRSDRDRGDDRRGGGSDRDRGYNNFNRDRYIKSPLIND